jgi:hypothetical protein
VVSVNADRANEGRITGADTYGNVIEHQMIMINPRKWDNELDWAVSDLKFNRAALPTGCGRKSWILNGVTFYTSNAACLRNFGVSIDSS